MAFPVANISPLNPDEFSSGRPTGFVGTITKVRYAPYVPPTSKTGKHWLSGYVSIEPDEDSSYQPFIEKYQAGFLNSSAASNDGPEIERDERQPAGGWPFLLALSKGEEAIPEGEEENYEGVYVVGQPLNRNTDWAQFLRSLRDCGYEFTSANVDSLQGLKVRFDLLDPVNFDNSPRHGKTTNAAGEEVATTYQVLCVTEIIENPQSKPAAKTTAKPGVKSSAPAPAAAVKKPTPAASTVAKPAVVKPTAATPSPSASTDSTDLRADLEAAILEFVAASESGSIPKAALFGKPFWEGPAAEIGKNSGQKGEAVKLIGSKDFWEQSESLVLDEARMVSLVG